MELSFWRKCSSCKKAIGFNQPYQRCSVTTCNQNRTSLVFCTVSCWSAHVPVLRHRDAWAVEELSPTQAQWANEQKNSSTDADVQFAGLKSASSNEVLVVASKMKAYIKDRSDMNTSSDVMDVLSDKLRQLCDEAIGSARREGRKTVMARDF